MTRSDAFKWLKANGHSLAPLTGQDSSALDAIAHCWDLYARGDGMGQSAALVAIHALLCGMQPKCRPLARELIARSMDWNDREKLWPLVKVDCERESCELCDDAWPDTHEPQPPTVPARRLYVAPRVVSERPAAPEDLK